MNRIRLRMRLFGSVSLFLAMLHSTGFVPEVFAQQVCDPSDPSCSSSQDPSDPSDPTPCDPSQPTCTISDAAIKSNATKEARKIANRITGTFGKRENHNYNFSVSFKDEYLRQVQSSSYDQGYRDGFVSGASFGEAYGNQAVRSEATQFAQADVAARFRAVLDLDVLPDVRVRVPAIRFDGVDQNPADNGFNAAFKKIADDLDYRLSRISWSYDGFTILAMERGTVKLRDVFSNDDPKDYSFSDYVFDSASGFASWQQGDYGGGYDTKLYRALATDQQKSLYRQTFRRVFEGVVSEKYYFARKRLNREATGLGQEFGEAVRLAHERAMGYTAGYRKAAKEASYRVYSAQFASLYEKAFESTVQHYNRNAVLETSDAIIATNDRFGFVPGSVISFSIQKAANLGRVAFESSVNFQSNDLDSVSGPVNLTVRPSSTNVPGLSVDRVATVSARTKANTSARLVVKFGAQTLSVEVPVKWSTVISDFSSRSRSDSRYATISAYLIEQLRTEFAAAIRNNSNVYSRQSLLGELVNQYSRMSQADRTNIKSLSSAISKISKEGGGFHPFIRSAYNSLASKIR